MNYSLATLWHDRSRFLPGILAVSFSAVLMALQVGLMLGLFSVTSIPIDTTRADIWVGSKDVKSVDLGRPIPHTFLSRLGIEGDIEAPEQYYQHFATWTDPTGGSELCIVIGSVLQAGDIGTPSPITDELKVRLTQPNSVVISEDEFERLKITRVGDKAKINNVSVQVVGSVKGFKSLAGPYIFCSAATAREVLRVIVPEGQSTYLLVRCKNPADARAIVERIRSRGYDDMSVFTAEEFSLRSRKHWLLKTKAGVAIGYAAILGLLVGMVVTSQTLYAATMASAREFAILLAMGIPRKRIAATVITQSVWVGLIGVVLAYPTVQALGALAYTAGGVSVLLRWYVLAGAAVVTMTMAVLSGLYALRSVRRIEPMSLLR